MKVMTLVGTRPEIIKLACVIPELDRAVQHVLVHTGQNYDYELNQIFFDGLGLRKPDHFLDAAGPTAAQTIANVIAKSDQVMRAEKPEAFLLLGDTNSCLAVIAAKRLAPCLALARVCEPSSKNTNSSPPSRHSVSLARPIASARLATHCSTSSPAA